MFAFSNNAGGGLFAARSSDGGATWLPSNGADFIIADGADSLVAACCDPTATWDEFGNLFISYLDDAATTNPVAISTNGGATFTPLANVGAGSVDQPTIVSGPGTGGAGGSVWLTWSQNGAIVASGAAVSGLGAGNVGGFSSPATVPGMTGYTFGDIVVGGNGQVVVTAQLNNGNNDPADIRVSTDADGLGAAAFSPFVVATNTNVGSFEELPAQPQRTIDSEAGLVFDRSGGPFDGRLYLVYTDETVNENNNFEIRVRTSDDNGATWSNFVRVNDDATTRSQFFPKIALDQTTGTVGVVWYDARNSGTNTRVQVFGSASDDGGATWSRNTLLSQGQTDGTVGATGGQQLGDYIGLTFQDGVMHPSWADNSNSTFDNPNGTLQQIDIYTAAVLVGPWEPQGPAPGINGQENVPPDDQINGAVQTLLVHPTNPNIMYVGGVSGGVWKSNDATSAAPHWVPLVDQFTSLSIGALEFDPTDATRQTLIAGVGITSSFFLGDTFRGVLRSTNGGLSWTELGQADLGFENITSVAARGSILLAASDNVWGGGLGSGLFRSTNGGANWSLISGTNGLPSGDVSDIVGDPVSSNILFAAVPSAGGRDFPQH